MARIDESSAGISPDLFFKQCGYKAPKLYDPVTVIGAEPRVVKVMSQWYENEKSGEITASVVNPDYVRNQTLLEVNCHEVESLAVK